ncbi:MAG TPA: hypothetical protein ACFYEK_01410 [Candidatus Wunengus sp. YC60]|uniref:hypothetical protein n=1 Tax=Candidatus Wunengus sp. YC60 TaxID=3367697 RepID=UPI004029AE71
MGQLTLKLNIVEESNSFIAYDCTGLSFKDNEGCWGAINVEKKSVTNSFFLITPPNLPLTSEPIKVTVFPDFPNRDDLGYEILPYMVGQTNNKMLSGLWKIKWVIEYLDSKGNKKEVSTTVYKILKAQVTCCVDQWSKIVDKNAFRDKKQQKVIELQNLLICMDNAIDNELNNEAVAIIELLNEQCVCPTC